MVSFLLGVVLSFFSARGLCQVYETNEILIDESKHDEQFFTYLSRPDIAAPRWNISVYDESALAPGYWFVSPYGIVDQADDTHDYIAPAIYDSTDGELVWNGGSLFRGFNTFNFKVSSFHGEDMISILQMREENGVLINQYYIVHKHILASGNLHDFQIIEDGAKALYITVDVKPASREDSLTVEYDGNCITRFTGFQERDIDSGEITFDWTPEGNIPLDESYLYRENHRGHAGHTPASDCPHNSYDYLHLNSVERLPDGDYLVSGRRTYAIYKISHKDGSIIWRLGGKRSDFQLEEGTHYTGQHDVRCLEQNKTHMVISMMDNAIGPADTDKTNPNSRGLIISVNTETFTAHEIAKFDHPYGLGAYSPDRGSVQMLPNGNAFVSWTKSALHSEHAPSGEVIAEANLPAGLKTYRSYKFPWVGKPKTPPDVFSQLVSAGDGNKVKTIVSVSWNGDTRAAKWNLYRTNLNGSIEDFVTSTPRTGFETTITATQYIPFVKVDAVDHNGRTLENSESRMAQTIVIPDGTGSNLGVSNVASWPDTMWDRTFMFFGGFLGCAVAMLVAYIVWKAWNHAAFPWAQKQQPYIPLDTDDIELKS